LFVLITSKPSTIKEVLQKKPDRYSVEGVYVISTPKDNEFVYIGKTRTKIILGRIADHRTMGTNSDLKMMLKIFPDYPQEIDKYLIRCAEVSDPRERMFFEHFTISTLQPPFNK
jgi:hypothetical protein